MGALYLAASHMNRRRDHLIGCNPIHQQTNRRHIGHRIHGTHFMKMYVCHRNTVCMTLRLRDQSIDPENILPDSFRHGKMMHNMFNVVHPAVMVMVLIMVMPMRSLILFHTIDLYRNMRTANAAFAHLLFFNRHPRNPYGIQFRNKSVRIRKQFQQRCRQHISCRPHTAV